MPESEPISFSAFPERKSEPVPRETQSVSAGGLQAEACGLCRLPVGRSKLMEIVNGTKLHFCCAGCLNIFRILFNSPDGPPADYRKTELYRACVASGLIPRGESDPEPIRDQAGPINPEPLFPVRSFDDELARELTLRIEGMWCIACSWLIEEVLRGTAGVLDARVLFLSDLAKVRYLPHRVDPEDVLARVSRLGYRISIFRPQSETHDRKKDLLVRLGVASILTMNVMMISLGLYGGFFEDLGQDGVRYFSYPLWVLSTPVIFYAGFPILKRAWLGLRFWATSMDTLIAVGTLAAYFYSVVRMLGGSLHLYFDTASMLVTLALLGKYIEMQARERASRGIDELYELTGSKVRVSKEGAERWAPSDTVQPGEEFLVLEGERIPIDGRIIEGSANLDESVLTGESRPVKKSVGDEASGGSLLLDGELRLRATRTGTDSSISRMAALMQEALTRKNPIELLADRITRRLVPVVLLLAALTALYLITWRSFAPDAALLRALTVLMITCPCALGIATPMAKVASIAVGRKKGLLVRDPAALEKAKDLDVILFDKTGTLTEGIFSLREVVTTGQIDAGEALDKVAAVEAHSDHFLAREIMRTVGMKAKVRWISVDADTETDSEAAAPVLPESATRYESFEGLGVKGIVRGEEVLIGNRRFICSRGLDTSVPALLDRRAGERESEGSTVTFFAWGGRVRGFLVFGDMIKNNAAGVILRLRTRGITTWLASGDSEATTRAVARQLKIDHYRGQVLPGDKMQLVKKLQEEGRRVGMVGDGINDAAALAQADVGFAFGAGADIVRKASDVTMLSNDPERIVALLDLSGMTTGIIRQNLFFAFFYNVLGIPLAIMGLLNPLVAVMAMFASSLTVIANTLRISENGKNTKYMKE